MVNPGKLKPLSERFWPKVKKSGPDDCWIWIGAKMSRGYGVISKGHHVEGRALAHRISYEMQNGPIPDAALFVCHRCDTPDCVNPHHLFLGTNADNVRDCYAKGRRTAPRSPKLSEQNIVAIRASGVSCLTLADQFSVHHSTITSIRRRKTWKNVK
jgi:hypothetical protein